MKNSHETGLKLGCGAGRGRGESPEGQGDTLPLLCLRGQATCVGIRPHIFDIKKSGLKHWAFPPMLFSTTNFSTKKNLVEMQEAPKLGK